MTDNELDKYFESAEFRKSLKQYEEMIANGMKAYFEAEQLTDIAEYYSKNGEIDKAQEAIELALILHPGSTDPLIFKARTCLLQGDIEAAKELAASIPDQNDREVFFLHAELMLFEERPDDAADYMEVKLMQEVDFDNTPEESYNTIYDITLLFYDNKYYTHAVKWAEKLMQYARRMHVNDNDMLQAKELLASCHLGCEHIEHALDLFNEIIDDDPYYERAWTTLGNIYAMQQRWAESIDAYDYALAIDVENYPAMLGKAHCFTKLNNNDQAFAIFDKLLQIDYLPPLVNFYYGQTLTGIGRFDQAIPYLLKAWESPYDDEILLLCYYNLSISYFGTGDVVTASHYYCLAKDMAPFSAEVMDLEAIFQRCLDRMKEIESEESDSSNKKDEI